MTTIDIENYIKSIAQATVSDIAKFILGIVGGYLIRLFVSKHPIKRLWKLNDITRLTICVSESCKSTENANDVSITHSNTGIGQVKSLGLIVASLSKAYSLASTNINFSSETLRDRLEGDIIILGGPVNNEVANFFFQSIKSLEIVDCLNHAFIWKKTSTGENIKYETSKANSTQKEYGLIVRMPNPFRTSKNSKSFLHLFAGCHSTGTIASAKYFTEEYVKEHKVWNPFDWKVKQAVFMLVEFSVRDDYPFNIKPVEIHRF